MMTMPGSVAHDMHLNGSTPRGPRASCATGPAPPARPGWLRSRTSSSRSPSRGQPAPDAPCVGSVVKPPSGRRPGLVGDHHARWSDLAEPASTRGVRRTYSSRVKPCLVAASMTQASAVGLPTRSRAAHPVGRSNSQRRRATTTGCGPGRPTRLTPLAVGRTAVPTRSTPSTDDDRGRPRPLVMARGYGSRRGGLRGSGAPRPLADVGGPRTMDP